MEITEKIKDALKATPSKTVAITYIIMLAYNVLYKGEDLPEILPLFACFSIIVAAAYIIAPYIDTRNNFVNMFILGVVSMAVHQFAMILLKLMDTLDFDMILKSSLFFGAYTVGVLFLMIKWKTT